MIEDKRATPIMHPMPFLRLFLFFLFGILVDILNTLRHLPPLVSISFPGYFISLIQHVPLVLGPLAQWSRFLTP